LPKWKGGGNEPENIQLLCANCHEEKTAEDMIGHPVSEKQKQQQSAVMSGRKLSLEHREKLSAAIRKPYKSWSPEARAHVKELRSKEIWSPERRAAHGRATAKGMIKKLREEVAKAEAEAAALQEE
jgi:hypothetical protein